MILRDYQTQAVDSMLQRMSLPTNDILVLPTGSGKSIVIADLVSKMPDKKILILQPTEEILRQNLEKILLYIPEEKVGVYSASFKSKEVKQVTLAMIGSVVNVVDLFSDFSVIIIDECHYLVPDKGNTSYRKFLYTLNKIRNGDVKLFGLTATPMRLSTTYAPPHFDEQVTTIKVITRMRGKAAKNFWDGGIIFNISTLNLLEKGYLHQPVYFDNTQIQHESIPVNKSQSDFSLDKYEELILPHEEYILDTISRLKNVSHSVLVFCTSVEQAERYAEVVHDSAVVSAQTKKKERKEILEKFIKGEIKVAFNVKALTTGFDHPRMDGLVMLRPTRSLALYSQMIGRILRKHPDKKIARVVDFSGNLKAMGKAETIELYKNNNLPDIKTSKKEAWHGTVLYKMKIQKASPQETLI